MRALRYIVGALAGLCDLAGSIRIRNWVFTRVAATGDTLDGFDLTSDLYLWHPKWLLRRMRGR